MHVAQVFALDVSIDLRCCDVGMAEHLLHARQVGAALEQMRGEGVTQSVRRHALANSCAPDMPLEDLPHAHACEWTTTRIHEHDPLRFLAHECRPDLAKIHD